MENMARKPLAATGISSARLAGVSAPSSRLRIINPRSTHRWCATATAFGAVLALPIRNENVRARAAQRQWGLLCLSAIGSATALSARIEIKADRSGGPLAGDANSGPKPGAKLPVGRQTKRQRELARLARLIGVSDVYLGMRPSALMPGCRIPLSLDVSRTKDGAISPASQEIDAEERDTIDEGAITARYGWIIGSGGRPAHLLGVDHAQAPTIC